MPNALLCLNITKSVVEKYTIENEKRRKKNAAKYRVEKNPRKMKWKNVDDDIKEWNMVDHNVCESLFVATSDVKTGPSVSHMTYVVLWYAGQIE